MVVDLGWVCFNQPCRWQQRLCWWHTGPGSLVSPLGVRVEWWAVEERSSGEHLVQRIMGGWWSWSTDDLTAHRQRKIPTRGVRIPNDPALSWLRPEPQCDCPLVRRTAMVEVLHLGVLSGWRLLEAQGGLRDAGKVEPRSGQDSTAPTPPSLLRSTFKSYLLQSSLSRKQVRT